MDYISVIGSHVKFRVKDSSQKSKLYLNGDQSVPQAHSQRPKGSMLGQDDKHPAKKKCGWKKSSGSIFTGTN